LANNNARQKKKLKYRMFNGVDSYAEGFANRALGPFWTLLRSNFILPIERVLLSYHVILLEDEQTLSKTCKTPKKKVKGTEEVCG
jgi:hypothetical protein